MILKLKTFCNQTTVEFGPESWREVTLICGNMLLLGKVMKKEKKIGKMR